MEIKADYTITPEEIGKPKSHLQLRFARWVVMDSPEWLKEIVAKMWPNWYTEYALFFILGEEISKEINAQIVKELEEYLKNEVNK